MTFWKLLFILVLISGTAQAKIYKWTDENGQTHYTATPPPKKKAENIEIKGRAQVYNIADISISIPSGFEGPIKDNKDEADVTGFTFPHDGGGATLFQITTINPGKSFPEMSEDELKAGAKQYLLQFLEGVKRKRNNFKQDNVNFIKVSGQPIAKVTWTGDARGKSLHGVMYSFIYNSKIYSFHTQDFTTYNKKYTKLAVKSFESITFKK